jgi:hypothetical protein
MTRDPPSRPQAPRRVGLAIGAAAARRRRHLVSQLHCASALVPSKCSRPGLAQDFMCRRAEGERVSGIL